MSNAPLEVTQDTDQARSPVQACHRTVDIVELLACQGCAGVTEVARELDIGKSTAHNYLSTLRDRGYVIRTDDGYRLASTLLVCAEHARAELDCYPIARDAADDLAATTDELVEVDVVENDRLVSVYKARGNDAIRTSDVDARIGEFHSSAGGKALLAAMKDYRVRQIVSSHGLADRNPATITDEDELAATLEEIRERGVAFERGEAHPDFHAVGASILDWDDNPLCALKLTIPARRSDESTLADLADRVKQAAADAEMRYNY